MTRKIRMINSEKEITVDDTDFKFMNNLQWYENKAGYAVTIFNKEKWLAHTMVAWRAGMITKAQARAQNAWQA